MRDNTQFAVVTQESNIGGEVIPFKMSQKNTAHIASLLINLYSNKEGAVAREYITNAIDSHKAAGNPEPVRVTLPNAFNPTFIVKDNGVGMSLDDLREIYSSYGESTKRQDNDVAGMLGLGCKSALTYTSQFTLVCIKDGRMVTALVSRASDNSGMMEVVEDEETDEPNGVTVKVPVKNYDQFNKAVRDFLMYSEPGEVLVNDEEPERVTGDQLDPDVLIVKRDHRYGSPAERTLLNQSDIVVMGGVPYPVEAGQNLSLGGSSRVVARVPMGSVNFPPSREALQYTDLTNDTLFTLKKFVRDVMYRRAQESIDKCSTHIEAIRENAKWRQMLPSRKQRFAYQGRELPYHFDVPFKRVFSVNLASNPSESYYSKVDSFNPDNLHKYVHVSGDVPKSISLKSKARLWKLLKKNDIPGSEVLVYETGAFGPWVDGATHSFTWDDVLAIDVSTLPDGRPADKVYYRVLERRFGYPAFQRKEKVTGRKIVLVSPSIANDIRYALQEVMGDWTAVSLHPNSFGKFIREHKVGRQFVGSIYDALPLVHQEWHDGLSEIEKHSISHEGRWDVNGTLSRLKHENVNDPELRKIIREVQKSDLSATRSKNLTFHNMFRAIEKPTPENKPSAQVKAVLDRYPLFRYLDKTAKPEELHQYVNAVHTYQENDQ